MTQLLLTRKHQKLLRSLHRRKGREANGLFLVEGVRGVEACLDAGWDWALGIVAPGLERSARGAALRARLWESAGLVAECSEGELARLAGTETPQGVLLAAALPAVGLAELSPPGEAACLVLDAVQDPGNVGTLIRTAHALGAFAAIALPGTADPWGPKAVRAAAGALFRLPVALAEGPQAIEWLRRHRFELLGADVGGEPLLRTEGGGGGGGGGNRTALVLGNEGAGLSAAARSACDRIVSVPVVSSADSLNVAVAGALLLDRLTRA